MLWIPRRVFRDRGPDRQTEDATCRVHNITSMVVVGQHTNCCCRHTSYDAYLRGIELSVVSDATCVYEPMTGEGEAYHREQESALSYIQTFYGAEVTSADQLL